MLARLTLVTLALSLVAAGCGSSTRSGPAGMPPLAPQDLWARQRVEAVLALYSFTDQGQEAVRRMQVHHMLGRPGWFGSSGYENFVGIGQAQPASIVHELSHTFWGAFPVEGMPELSWKVAPGERISPGIAALRRDLDTFMQQPPDSYEPLRARLRQIPDLITGGFPGLYHLGEASIVHFTGANLNLVPPILRKYYTPWFEVGALRSWDQAIEWFLTLPPEERRIAGVFTGVGDMPRDGYSVEADPAARVEPSLARLVMTEKRQRLEDFVAQFDLYFKAIDGLAAARDFKFWRGYLRDMAALSRLFPEVLEGQGQPQQIRQALQFVLEIDSLPHDERAGSAGRRLLESRFLLKFSPALDHRTLAELVSSRESEVDRRVASLVSDALEPLHLRYLTTAVELLAVVEERPEEAVRAFERFIGKLDEPQLDQMNFILELFAGVDRAQTKQLLTMISPETALLVLQEGPAYVRFLTEPEALVQVLGFGGDLTLERLVELSRLTNEYVIGRPEADEPYLKAAYRRIVERGRGSPGEALRVFSESGLLVEPFLRNFPEEASALVSADLPVAAQVFRDANPVRLPPARAVYRLIQADPAAAARLTLQYDRMGERETVQDALVFFAYDDARLRAQPGLSDISLANDGRFLAELVRLRGEGWLRDQLASSRQRFEIRLEAGEVEAGFIEAYRETVAAGVEALEDEVRQAIERAVAGALG